MIDKSGSVPVSSIRRVASGSFMFYPKKSLCVKHTQITVILFPVIPTKNEKFLIVKCCSVILDLRSAQRLTSTIIKLTQPTAVDVLTRLLRTHILMRRLVLL
jgi:hypothetical protein